MNHLLKRYLLTFSGVIALATVWEFGLEGWFSATTYGASENFSEHLEYVVTIALFTLAALIPPFIHALQQEKRYQKGLPQPDQAPGKQLSILIPVCSYCNKIRDPEGQWISLEQFLHKHSDTLLTHGICPDCYHSELSKLAPTDADQSAHRPD